MDTTTAEADGWSAPFTGSIVPVPQPQGTQTVKALLTRKVGNLPIKVPAVDWTKVVTGEKRVFRTYSYGGDPLAHVVPADERCPRPCVLYTRRGNHNTKHWEAAAGVLNGFYRAPLGSLSAEDLADEGFEFMGAFRRYWLRRYPKLGWRPWDEVTVLEVAPLTDWGWAAEWAVEQLYDEVIT